MPAAGILGPDLVSTYSLRIAYLVENLLTTDFLPHIWHIYRLLDFGGSIDHFLAPSIHLDKKDRHGLLQTIIKKKKNNVGMIHDCPVFNK